MSLETITRKLTIFLSQRISSTMHGVFLDQQTFRSSISLHKIEQQLDSLINFPITSTEQIVDRSLDAEIIITNKVLLTADVLKQLPKLKLICLTATGTNNVDLIAAKELGIAVCNVSGYSTPSVSQYVFAQMLEYYSQTSHHNQNCADEQWQNSPTFCYHGRGFSELSGKTLGIVGYGNLGQAVANIGQAFGMEVLIAERPNATTIRTGRESFQQVLKQADILSLHCPQTPDTENLINAQTLSFMKPTAMLINTARGPLVNSKDLLCALQSKKIAYAVLDVLEQEPPPADHILLQAISHKRARIRLDNLKITAHIAWGSIEAQQRLLDLVADNIDAFKNGKSMNRVA